MMFRFEGHSVRGPKTVWCGGKVAQIKTTWGVTGREHSCGKCGQVATPWGAKEEAVIAAFVRA